MKKLFSIVLILTLAVSLAACGETKIANPWRDVTEEEAVQNCVRLFRAPEGAENVKWSLMDSTEAGLSPMVQLTFDLDGLSFTARAQQGAAEDADLSGLYYNWMTTEDTTLANWGEGRMEATVRRTEVDGKALDLCTWYDVEIGIGYTLSVLADDLDGFDIRAVAEAMYDPAHEPEIP